MVVQAEMGLCPRVTDLATYTGIRSFFNDLQYVQEYYLTHILISKHSDMGRLQNCGTYSLHIKGQHWLFLQLHLCWDNNIYVFLSLPKAKPITLCSCLSSVYCLLGNKINTNKLEQYGYEQQVHSRFIVTN